MSELVRLAREALKQQRGIDLAQPHRALILHPGDRIEWTRADGSAQHGVVDYTVVADGGIWAFVTQQSGWSAVNLKCITMVVDVPPVDGGRSDAA